MNVCSHVAPPAAILDIDGTLVDSTFHHALAWWRALRDHDVAVPVWLIHRHIGMGGDQIVAAVAGDEVEARLGDEVRERESERYSELLDEVRPLDGARALVVELARRAPAVVLSSSAKESEVEHYLELLEVRNVVTGWTSSDDVDATKPEPDLIEAALEMAGTRAAVMVGDSAWDCESARRAGIAVIGVLRGGFGAQELGDAGARMVVESPAQLVERIAWTPWAGATSRAVFGQPGAG